MRLFTTLLLLFALGCMPAALPGAAKKETAPADAAPQLLSTTGGGAPKWSNTRELKAYAAKGDAQACFELGARLLDGDDEVPGDPVQARVLFETAARGGVADAHFRLGKMYHDARGVTRDYAKALEHYLAAARRGVPEAQHNIGAMLVSARGVKRDFVEGLAWLLVAEQAGAASAAPQQVRDRLAKRPAEIAAAEVRAEELSADLAHAIIRTGPPLPAAAPRLPTAPSAPVERVAPTISAPAMDPITPPKVALPPNPPALPR